MPKLTDSQLAILSAAAKREDRTVLPFPKSLKLKGRALHATLTALCRNGLLAEQPARREQPAWREDADGRRTILKLTDAGLHAIDAGDAAQTRRTESSNSSSSRTRSTKSRRKPDFHAQPRPGSKQALLLELLRRKAGASLAEIVAATGWQPHSVRGAISGTARKKLGLTVSSERVEQRGRVYRMTGHA
jgi:hypothetical protein